MDGLAAILRHIDAARVLDLLKDAVDAYSPSWAEDPATRVFAAALARAGIPCRLEPVPGNPGNPRANLVVEMGPRPASLLWVGHVDTVTMPDDTPDHGARQDGDVLHGLGTADMKSGCAAMVEALAAVAASGVPLRRGLVAAFVVGEEEFGDGSRALLQRDPPPLTVVGEPTGLVPCTTHYGYLECLLSAAGTGAHAALPEIGRNAIQAMLEWLSAGLRALPTLPDAETLAINLRHIRGGGEKFVVPDRCEALLDVHLPPDGDADAVMALLRRAGEGLRLADVQLGLRPTFLATGYRLDPSDPVLAPVRQAFSAVGRPFAPGVFRSHSDAAMFREAGSSPVICGPGRLETAHTADEHVSIAEVVDAARLYAAMIHAACG